MNWTDLTYLSATELSDRIRRKVISPVEVVSAVFARIHAVNPAINAYCTLDEEQALAQAKEAERVLVRNDAALGPLHGVPFSVKDLVLTRGVRTMRGSRLFEGFVPDCDAPAVERLKRAGAILLGKTATPELGFKGVTESPVSGISRNPWNVERTPGGSSGGAAAAVAAGLGPLALGTDGGGSIRAPAAFCGIFGLKPSFGRVPSWPPAPVPSLLHVGPMSRSVRDAALMLNVIAGPDHRDLNTLPASWTDFLDACAGGARGLRVAWSRTIDGAPVDPEVARLAEAAARVFADELGARVEPVELELGISPDLSRIFWLCGIGAYLENALPEQEDLLDPDLARRIEHRGTITGIEYARALKRKTEVAERAHAFFARYDLLLTPTLPLAAFPADSEAPTEIGGRPLGPGGFSPFTLPFNLTGQPAASVPCGFTSDGLPVGLQIVGQRFDDATVLRASAAFEAARPWRHHRPNLAEYPG
ncbi:amidase [Methylococcus mesophilus]|uniref:amidase n=1 Tax=Methylococcus mesophilus TaxID=2993564 RepID=UPI00224B94EB|nr:amidase [Methylococcus mesophilus]UZR28814.1 amidase [Methylococcus mesophilus]